MPFMAQELDCTQAFDQQQVLSMKSFAVGTPELQVVNPESVQLTVTEIETFTYRVVSLLKLGSTPRLGRPSVQAWREASAHWASRCLLNALKFRLLRTRTAPRLLK